MQITQEQYERLVEYLEKQLDDDLPFMPSVKQKKLDIARQFAAGELDVYATNEERGGSVKIDTLAELYAFAREGYGTVDAVPAGQSLEDNGIDLGDYSAKGEAEAGVILAFLLREGQFAWETHQRA